MKTRLIASAVLAVALGIGAADAGPRSMKLGNSWDFQLPGNPSTGYSWQLDKGASSGLEFVKVDAVGYGEPESNLIGAPAPFIFRFTCVAEGYAHLVFNYVPPGRGTAEDTHETWVRCD